MELPMQDVVGIHHIGLTVSDLDRSVRWYTDVFGLTTLVAFEEDGGERHKVLLRHPASGLVFGLVIHRTSTGGDFDETRIGLDHLSFSVASLADLETWQQHLERLGVPHSPIAESRGGSRVLVFRDPDNIQLEVIAGSGQPESQ